MIPRETATKEAGKMRPHALCGAKEPTPAPLASCPVCGKPRPKNRNWSTYCSDKCRKTAWRIRKGEESSPSVIERLNRIESKLDALLGAK